MTDEPAVLTPQYHAHTMAVDRVAQRLGKVTAALDAAGVRYAVVGGNAVAAWVGRVDPSATRATKDVDLLVDRDDLDRITAVLRGLGFRRDDVRGLVMFIDPDEPSRRAGVHLVWAGDRVRPSYPAPAPSVTESVRDPQGFSVLSLEALVRMKLTSFRLIDQVHVQDMLRLGLIGDVVRAGLPEALRERLEQVEELTEE
jgi:hypothetical protein